MADNATPAESADDKDKDNLMIQLYNDTLEGPVYYRGMAIVIVLFYMYLARRYQTHCLFANEQMPIHFTLILEKRNGELVGTTPEDDIEDMRLSFTKCLENQKPLIFFMLGVVSPRPPDVEEGSKEDKSFAHENLIIFRRATRTFEHFEPHGKLFLQELAISNAVENHILEVLRQIYPHPFDYLPAAEVCPTIWGPQSYESRAPEKYNGEVEGYGYCAAWSLFFAEMCLRNPQLNTSAEVQQNIDAFLEKYPFEERKVVTRKIIRSYARRMGQVLYDHYSLILRSTVGIYMAPGETISPENVIFYLQRDEERLLGAALLLVNMEMDYAADPEIAAELPQGEELSRALRRMVREYRELKGIDVPEEAEPMKYTMREVVEHHPLPAFQSPELVARLRREEQALVDSQQLLRAAQHIPTDRLEQKIQKYQKPTLVNKWLKTRKLKKYQGKLQAVQGVREAARKDVADRLRAVQETEEALKTAKPKNAEEELWYAQHVLQPAMRNRQNLINVEQEQEEYLDEAREHLQELHDAYHGNIAAHPARYGGRCRTRKRRRSH